MCDAKRLRLRLFFFFLEKGWKFLLESVFYMLKRFY